MSSTEFNSWKAFYLLEPFGTAREDERAGVIAATVANVFRPKNRPAIKPEKFFPRHKRRVVQDWEDMLALVEGLNIAMGGKDLRKKRTGDEAA